MNQVLCGDDLDRLLEACLNDFIEKAPVQSPRQLLSILNDAPPGYRQFILIELIKLDLSLAAEDGMHRRIQWYVDGLDGEFTIKDVPLDLVMEEIQLRKEVGERPRREDYAKIFPQFADILENLLASVESTQAIRHRGPPPELPEGTVVDDFAILLPLGRGAFANVYLARQLSMQRLVALKVSGGQGDESRNLAQLDHPNIVRIYDQRTLSDRKLHLMYMQYVPGGTLSDLVSMVRKTFNAMAEEGCKSTVPLSSSVAALDGNALLQLVDEHLLRSSQAVPERSPTRQWLRTAAWPELVAWIGVQLADALDHAHSQGVLHRDVKPANVLLTAEGIAKLADFNVSFSGAAGRVGAAATFGGSIAYMAPEHLRAIHLQAAADVSDVGPSADLFSLAVLLWELWQGHRPFGCRNEIDSWTAALTDQLESRYRTLRVSHRDGGVSERVLEQVLRRALSTDPALRPSSGSEMEGRLRLALNPEAAAIFDPEPQSLRSRIAKSSPWLVIAAVLFLPHVAAGAFNYYYNAREIIGRHPAMTEGFKGLCYAVNFTFFPCGLIVIILLARPVVIAVKRAGSDKAIKIAAIDALVTLSRRAAVIGGGLWAMGGVVFAVVLSLQYDSFPRIEAFHFVLSMLICGGVAAVYPFFGMTTLATHVYYPLLVRRAMRDPKFDRRSESVKLNSGAFLIHAAVIPLLAVILLVSRSVVAKDLIVTAVAVSVLGLIASFAVYLSVVATWQRMGEVLSQKPSSGFPR